MLKIKNLSIKFENEYILENLSLDIEENISTIIAGKSGSGKSVLVHCIERLLSPEKGEIILDGQNIFSLSNKEMKELRKTKLTMLFQNSALFDSYNVYQNIAFPLFEHTKFPEKIILEKVKESLELVGLSNVLSKMPSELSGGMQKRVALARAIILKPKYIIYDEPTTGLDSQTSNDIINLINKIKTSGNFTSIIITHDLNCIEKTADKVALLENKKIAYYGDKETYFKLI